ncbi:MAG: 16S rRNA (adenine(1518)-N(6)/adenine(1519)-N(6))-dimethyltransferase RsmA [Ruminococcaceae bacterium]|nr:16S rRNA (adenine(1518)-N(6)/adenine(1519)-N(6))-dimethyltransferase RsmA [Oscillospiraceae bacterium]
MKRKKVGLDASKKAVRAQLSGEGLRPKKGLGQNFLTDESVLCDIVEAAQLTEDSCVLEIGPGMGALTRHLAQRAKKVVAVEIDTAILPVLEKNLTGFSNVTVINRDILKLQLEDLFSECFGKEQVKVIANLPYYITTPIIMKLLAEKRLSSIVIMIQREVAERLAAGPGTKNYGALSLAVQYRAQVRPVRDVSPEAFHPVPKVWSSVIALSLLKEPPVAVLDEAHFFHLIHGAFSQRRKTFINSAGSYPPLCSSKEHIKSVLQKLGISENIRGESLSLEQFAQISNEMVRGKL